MTRPVIVEVPIWASAHSEAAKYTTSDRITPLIEKHEYHNAGSCATKIAVTYGYLLNHTLLQEILVSRPASASLSRHSAAPMTPATWSARRTPTIAPVTAGLRSTHAIAASPAVRPCGAAIRFNTSANARFRVSAGSWKSGLRRRQSSCRES